MLGKFPYKKMINNSQHADPKDDHTLRFGKYTNTKRTKLAFTGMLRVTLRSTVPVLISLKIVTSGLDALPKAGCIPIHCSSPFCLGHLDNLIVDSVLQKDKVMVSLPLDLLLKSCKEPIVWWAQVGRVPRVWHDLDLMLVEKISDWSCTVSWCSIMEKSPSVSPEDF